MVDPLYAYEVARPAPHRPYPMQETQRIEVDRAGAGAIRITVQQFVDGFPSEPGRNWRVADPNASIVIPEWHVADLIAALQRAAT